MSGTHQYLGKDLRECGRGEAYLLGSKAVIFNVRFARCVFSKGFFGKPVGVRKPKSTDVDQPIELSLIEAIYLVEKGVIDVIKEGRRVGLNELIGLAESLIDDFEVLYNTYRELRDAGFIVRSALKYGADFALYRLRPGLEHAPYLVKVLRYGGHVDPGDLIGWGRLSHSVRKELLLAITYPSGERSYIMFKWFRP
ncbi:MAG: tRNA-intron lyase [Desulfurococcales archaeon ex4484_204]|nr:MAG: tRNA-intron lyase [Desulfurococcales archaeon ex4484_204]